MTVSVEWPDIAAVTGASLGEFDAACPVCGPDRRRPANRQRKVLRVWRPEPDYATYYCARCGSRGWAKPEQGGPARPRGDLLRAFDPVKVDRAKEAREAARRAAWAEFTYLSADPVKGTIAETYLASRRLNEGQDMRFAGAVPRTYDGPPAGPAMLVAVRHRAGEITGAQATHLDPEGRKIRRTTFGRVAGGAVRLAEIGAVGVLAVAEGVETALAFNALYDVPTWAALSAVGLERFEPPDGLRRLIVAGDNDASGRGQEAADALARRASRTCEAVVSLPPSLRGKDSTDWADVWMREAPQ